MVLGGLFKSKKQKRREEEERKHAEAAERHRLAEEAAKQESFIHSDLLLDPLDAVATQMLAVFAEMEEAGELAERWEEDGVLHRCMSYQSLIDAVGRCDLSFTDAQALQLFQDMDIDGDAVIQLSEFHAFCKANPDWATDFATKRSVTGRIITPGGVVVTELFEKIEAGGFRVVETFFLVDMESTSAPRHTLYTLLSPGCL